MPTILDICNAALNACGSDDVLTGLNNGVITDANKSGRLCNQNYNLARRAVLAKHPWKFSIVRVVIPIVADVTLQPPFGGRNAFPVPIDYIRAITVNDRYEDFIREGRFILAYDAGPINLRYVCDEQDVTVFDQLFFDAVALDLAVRIVYPLSQSNERVKDLMQMYQATISKARFVDSIEQSQRVIAADTFTDARLVYTSAGVNLQPPVSGTPPDGDGLPGTGGFI